MSTYREIVAIRPRLRSFVQRLPCRVCGVSTLCAYVIECDSWFCSEECKAAFLAMAPRVGA